MPNINIAVADKIATNMSPGVQIVCGNNDYTMTFSFDEEWKEHPLKTARFVYTRDGKVQYTEVVFSGTVAQVPVLSGITAVYVGVYAGELHTTTPARVLCQRSILCGGGTHEEPSEDVYNQIIAECNRLAGLASDHPNRTDNPHKTTAVQIGARPDTWTPTAEEVGARPNTWTPTAAEVGARPNTWTPTAAQVGARPDTWTPTAAEVGARPNTWTPTAAEVGARSDTWLPTIAEIGAAPAKQAIHAQPSTVGWYRVGTVNAYNCYRVTISTIWNSKGDMGAIIDVCASLQNPVLTKASAAFSQSTVKVVDQVRLVKNPDKSNQYYMDIHWQYSAIQDCYVLMDGPAGWFAPWAEWTTLGEDAATAAVTLAL